MKKQVSVKSPFSKAALHYNYIKKEHVTAQPFERGAVFLGLFEDLHALVGRLPNNKKKKLTLLQSPRIIYCAQPKPIVKYQTPGFGHTAHTLPLHYRE